MTSTFVSLSFIFTISVVTLLFDYRKNPFNFFNIIYDFVYRLFNQVFFGQVTVYWLALMSPRNSSQLDRNEELSSDFLRAIYFY